VSELGMGLLMGTAVTMILNSVRLAGQFIDLQIGYAMATLVDPSNSSTTTLVSQFTYLAGLMFFLVMDGHHALIAGLAKSFEMVPLGAVSFNGSVTQVLLRVFCDMLVIALQVSAPVLAVLLVSDLVLGFLARTAPQINVFVTGFPVKIIAGLLTLSFMVPFIGALARYLLNMLEKDLSTLLRALSYGR